MSLLVIKAGLLDTIQDTGRKGYQHLGINTSGAMDTFSAQLANAMLGKALHEPVIEMHFPAPHFLFKEPTIICLTGANFQPVLDNKRLPLAHPVLVPRGAILHFERMVTGARCYLSTWHGWCLEQWMGSYSTNLKAGKGGWNGRALMTGDALPFHSEQKLGACHSLREACILRWTTNLAAGAEKELAFIPGNEWCWLTRPAQEIIVTQPFSITPESDRMGYRLSGTTLEVSRQQSLVSTAVNFGTMQLLPNGQLVILMADHQTTGGYPRVGHIASAHLPLLAQKRIHENVSFRPITLEAAQKEQADIDKNLRLLQYACKSKLEELLNDNL